MHSFSHSMELPLMTHACPVVVADLPQNSVVLEEKESFFSHFSFCTRATQIENLLLLPIMTSLSDILPPGVVTGDNLLTLLKHAKDNGYAIPAFNCTRSVTMFLAVCSSDTSTKANLSTFFSFWTTVLRQLTPSWRLPASSTRPS